MRVARIGLSRLPLAGPDIDGHHFKGRRGGSRNRFFAERKGESEVSRYARIEPTRFIILPTRILFNHNRALWQVRERATEHGDAGYKTPVTSMSKDFFALRHSTATGGVLGLTPQKIRKMLIANILERTRMTRLKTAAQVAGLLILLPPVVDFLVRSLIKWMSVPQH
jgi:hypothetical protein